MARDWTLEENQVIVEDYFAMLHAELRGLPFNKREHNRHLRRILPNRSSAAVERKHMNISAVLREMQHPWIEGYKPFPNYQADLWNVVVERLSHDEALSLALRTVVGALVSAPMLDDVLGIEETPPRAERTSRSTAVKTELAPYRSRPLRQVDYLAQEARNQSLGRGGEELVLRYEEQRLLRAGRRELARRIEHISASYGDGAGFDVLSFELNGRERWIEVKTTGFGKRTPFYVSRNEVECSRERDESYQLYRVFGFRTSPGLFRLRGALDRVCDLAAVTYLGRVA
jgi:hypothetical protein